MSVCYFKWYRTFWTSRSFMLPTWKILSHFLSSFPYSANTEQPSIQFMASIVNCVVFFYFGKALVPLRTVKSCRIKVRDYGAGLIFWELRYGSWMRNRDKNFWMAVLHRNHCIMCLESHPNDLLKWPFILSLPSGSNSGNRIIYTLLRDP
jgi:hypothetical protein